MRLFVVLLTFGFPFGDALLPVQPGPLVRSEQTASREEILHDLERDLDEQLAQQEWSLPVEDISGAGNGSYRKTSSKKSPRASQSTESKQVPREDKHSSNDRAMKVSVHAAGPRLESQGLEEVENEDSEQADENSEEGFESEESPNNDSSLLQRVDAVAESVPEGGAGAGKAGAAAIGGGGLCAGLCACFGRKKEETEEDEGAPLAQAQAKAKAKAKAKGKAKAKAKPGAKAKGAAKAKPKAAPAPPSDPFVRPVEEGSQLALELKKLSARDCPEVDLLGSIDPFLQFRYVHGHDPSKDSNPEKLQAAPDPLTSFTTSSKEDTENPTFQEKFHLTGIVNSTKAHLHIILWDTGVTANTPVGHEAIKISDLVEDMKFDLKAPPSKERQLKLDLFQAADKKTTVKFHYTLFEMLKLNIHVKSAFKVPKMDTANNKSNSFMTIRLMQNGGEKDAYNQESAEVGPSSKCLCKVDSSVQYGDPTPIWDETLSLPLPSDPDLKLQFILNHAEPNHPVGQHVIKVSEILEALPNMKLPFVLKFKKVPGSEETADIKKTTAEIELWYEIIPPEPADKKKDEETKAK